MVADGPAGKAGIKAGDGLVKLGNDDIASLPDLVKALQQHKPGDKLTIEVERQGKTVELSVELVGRRAGG